MSNPIDPNAATTRRPSVAGVELACVAFGCLAGFWRAGKRRPLPDDFSSGLVERVDLPLVFGEIVSRLHVTVQAGAKGPVAGLADGRRHEHSIAPDDRARVGHARNRRLPLDVLAAGDVPFGHRALPIGVSASGDASKRWPIAGLARRSVERRRCGGGCGRCVGCDGCVRCDRCVGCVGCVRCERCERCGGRRLRCSAREHDRRRALHELDRFCEAAAFVERQRRGHALHSEYSRRCGRKASRRLALYLGDK